MTGKRISRNTKTIYLTGGVLSGCRQLLLAVPQTPPVQVFSPCTLGHSRGYSVS